MGREALWVFAKRVWVKWWPALKPALYTAGFTFVTVFAGVLTGWLNDVAGWLEAPDGAAFPDPSVLWKGVIAAVTATATGLVNFVVRAVQLARGTVVVEYGNSG
ncbi:MAG: hypothetical protein GY926_10845 [bacterium]|nr:hypothetical protein [bacterium]